MTVEIRGSAWRGLFWSQFASLRFDTESLEVDSRWGELFVPSAEFRRHQVGTNQSETDPSLYHA